VLILLSSHYLTVLFIFALRGKNTEKKKKSSLLQNYLRRKLMHWDMRLGEEEKRDGCI